MVFKNINYFKIKYENKTEKNMKTKRTGKLKKI